MSTGALRELCVGEHTKVPAVDKTRAGECHRSILSPYCGTSGSAASVPGRNNPSEGVLLLLLTALLVFSLGQASPGGRARCGSQTVAEGQGSTAGSQPLGCRR